ncbi:hypothetical protein [Salipiger mucosus]|uniref:Uncharacterized protein n=1 Tax=Salipiger mucosus DSM 16094 TaxID=1123237 RepID=S9QQ67_9RHOB|nr:hypothetical protein [Salipiger mucosus]EPX83541.1 hypothetical protein Salmuc_02149 [Salipiger mucosus DSM 16094]
MAFSLRKLNSLQHEIRAQIEALETPPVLEVNAFDDPVQRAPMVAEEWSGKRQDAEKLREVLFEIRKTVSAANHVSGLNDVLADTAMVDEKIKATRKALEKDARPSDDVLSGTKQKILEDDGRSTMFAEYNHKVPFGALNQEVRGELEQELTRLRKQHRDLKDQALEINVENKVDLSPSSVSVLEQHGVI